jgi:chorismate lyase/3-hydroxybenzoate synthase
MAAPEKYLQTDLAVRQASEELPVSGLCNELFRFRFGKEASVEAEARIFQLHIDPIGPHATDEIWFANSSVRTNVIGNFMVAESDDYLAAHIEIDLKGVADFKDLTTQVYHELLQLTRERGYPNLVRVWNYFPGINTGHGDHELYRQFTAGRAIAYGEIAHQGEALPAATAIGTDEGTPFTVSAIAARNLCQTIENPRQTSAYKYPREYGSVSPSFSRAVVVASASGNQILISGTASIVGHQSLHLNDLMQQTIETLQNLKDLVRHARCELQTQNIDAKLLRNGNLRVYLREPKYRAEIEKTLRDALGKNLSLVFLRGDICRRDLLLEIEAAGDI